MRVKVTHIMPGGQESVAFAETDPGNDFIERPVLPPEQPAPFPEQSRSHSQLPPRGARRKKRKISSISVVAATGSTARGLGSR